MGAAAVVIRNSYGEAVAGWAWPIENLLNATMVEAIALRAGLQLLKKLDALQLLLNLIVWS